MTNCSSVVLGASLFPFFQPYGESDMKTTTVLNVPPTENSSFDASIVAVSRRHTRRFEVSTHHSRSSRQNGTNAGTLVQQSAADASDRSLNDELSVLRTDLFISMGISLFTSVMACLLGLASAPACLTFAVGSWLGHWLGIRRAFAIPQAMKDSNGSRLT